MKYNERVLWPAVAGYEVRCGRAAMPLGARAAPRVTRRATLPLRARASVNNRVPII